MEFFRCAYTALGSSLGICHADVGKLFGSPGALDFYINSKYQWAIELVRQSDRLQEHLDRFSDTGMYKDIPIKDYVLLNFVSKPDMGVAKLQNRLKFAKPKHPKEIRVYYARGCSELKICMLDLEKPISL